LQSDSRGPVHLDGTPVASIGSGKTVEIEVALGLHEITGFWWPKLRIS
jgi:hypothetical protein